VAIFNIQDNAFVGEMVAWINEAENILKSSASHHPQSMDLLESANQTIQTILSKMSLIKIFGYFSTVCSIFLQCYASGDVQSPRLLRDCLWIFAWRQLF